MVSYLALEVEKEERGRHGERRLTWGGSRGKEGGRLREKARRPRRSKPQSEVDHVEEEAVELGGKKEKRVVGLAAIHLDQYEVRW